MESAARTPGTYLRDGRILREGEESWSSNEYVESGLHSTGSPHALADCGIVDALRGPTRRKVRQTLLTAGQQVEGLGAVPAGAVVTRACGGEFAQDLE